MIPETGSVTPGPEARSVTLERVAWLAAIVFCGMLPLIALVALFVGTIQDDTVAFDFRPFYSAAGALLEGRSPYPSADDPLTAESGAYVYPPLTAIAVIPFRALSPDAAGLLVMAILVCALLGTLLVLGVRDWRCHGMALLWPPVLSAIQTGNLTILLGLAAALAWRLRDRPLASSAAVGGALAAKFFLWTLLAWYIATRRLAAAGLACAFAFGLLVLSWAAIGFAGLVDYPELMRRLDDSIGMDSYTAYIAGLDLGLPSVAARAIWVLLGLGLLAAVLVVGRRGDERSAFILALAAALALTPIVWLHYFALLVVVVALAQPRLGLVWFVPLGMVVTPGSGHPSPFETSATLAVAAVTVALALRASSGRLGFEVGSAAPDAGVAGAR